MLGIRPQLIFCNQEGHMAKKTKKKTVKQSAKKARAKALRRPVARKAKPATRRAPPRGTAGKVTGKEHWTHKTDKGEKV